MVENNELGFDSPEKLIDEDYSYENIVKNPILKSIAETDRTIIDITEMACKKALDASKDKKAINDAIQDVPAYQTSEMVGRLVRRNDDIDDLVKMQNLIIKNLRKCIKEIYKDVISKYGVYKEDRKEVKSIDYIKYLSDLVKNSEIKEIVIKIVDEFNKDSKTTKEKVRFENACGNVYAKAEKDEKIIIAKIMRMEY